MKRASILVVFLGCLGLAACNAGPGTPASLPGRLRLDHDLSLGRPFRAGNLTVWPVYCRNPVDLGDFATLEEAEAAGQVAIREVGAAGDAAASAATVGRLEIENRGHRTVLIPSGTVVKGGKQDRQIGEDTVVPPGQRVEVRSFCVEPGRWTLARGGQSTGGLFFVEGAVAAAPVRYQAQYGSNQFLVWHSIAQLCAIAGKSPATGTYLAVADEKDPAVKARRQRLEKAVTDHFRALQEPAVGFAYAVNGHPVAVRTFAHPRLFQQQFKAFLRAICLEADLARDPKHPRAAPPASAKDVVALVQAINREEETLHPSLAGNRIGIRRGRAGANGNCYVEHNGTWVAVSRDWTASPAGETGHGSRLPGSRW